MKWINVNKDVPRERQCVLAWTSGGTMFLCRYRKALTWKGYRLKFINMLSSGLWVENVTHWMPLPEGPKEEKELKIREDNLGV